MNLEAKFEGELARKQAANPPPFGPAFEPEIVAKTETLEIHGSSFKDPGPDYCEFRAFDATGNLLGRKRLEGY